MTSELQSRQPGFNWKQTGLFFLAILLFTGAMFYRRADAFTNPQFWAEDGMVFFMEQDHHEEFIPFQNYQGYIHFIPRCIAYLAKATQLPYEYVPTFYNYCTYLIYLIVFSLVWKYLPVNFTTKALMIAGIGILPISFEVFMNVTNVQWLTSLILIILFYDFHIKKTADILLLSLAAILAALTGPFSVIIMPLLFIRCWQLRRKMSQLIPVIVAIVFGMLQAYYMYSHPNIRPKPLLPIPEHHLWTTFYVTIHQLFFFKHTLVVEFKWWYMLLILPFITGYILLIIQGLIKKQSTQVMLLLYAGLLTFSTIYISWPYEWLISPFLGGMRYFFIPFTLIWFYLLNRLEKTWHLQIGFMIILFVFFFMHRKWVSTTFIDYKWKEEVKQYRETGEVIAPINPPGWFVVFKQKNK